MHSPYSRRTTSPAKRGQTAEPKAVRRDVEAMKAEIDNKANASRVGGLSTRINAIERAIEGASKE